MNYMKQVAHMLGVEIGEEFKIEGHSDNVKYRLTEENLEYFLGGKGFIISSTLNKLLNGEYKVVKLHKPILDEKEKEYLSYVIRPFRDRVKYLFKGIFLSNNFEFIGITFNDDDIMFFPSFEVGIMYKGMELEKEYTLEDLGL